MNEFELYKSGLSIQDVNKETGIPLSTLRNRFKKRGILRSRIEGIKIAAKQGKMGDHNKGKKKPHSDEAKIKMSKSRLKWAEKNAKGVSVKPNGYEEYTNGEHKGRLVHVVKMEKRIGRRLFPDECVHHIDGDKLNNDENNLAFLTRSGHNRLHRFEDKLAGKERERKENGRFA